MTFDNSGGPDLPEYEASKAALEMAEKDTKATMLRVARASERESTDARQENEAPAVGARD